MEIVRTETPYRSETTQSKVPVTIEWKGVRMIRGHSLLSSIRQIVRMVQAVDVVRVQIIADMGYGKTTFARSLSHCIHEISKKEYNVPFAVKEFTKTELLDFENTIKQLEPVNTVVIFDDVSFLNDKKKIDKIKQQITEVRHLQNADVKIVIIMISHYTLAVQKYLRQAQFSYFASIGSSEMDNMIKIVGTQYIKLLHKFQKVVASATTKGKFSFNLGKKNKFFTYDYREPFIPLLFYNNDKLRIVVSPKLEWLDKFCSTCHKSKKTTMKEGIPVKEFAKDLESKFGKQISRNAIRLILHQNGLNVYPKSVKYCLTYINKYISDKIPNLQDLAEFYNFADDKAILNHKYIKDLKK